MNNGYLCLILLAAGLFLTTGCGNEQDHGSPDQPRERRGAQWDSTYGSGIPRGRIGAEKLTEASGLAVSRRNDGFLWSHNDSGDGSNLFLISTTGKHRATYSLEGVENRDWEDIAVGPGPDEGRFYIYLSDTGDNLGWYDTYFIYRIPEPAVDTVPDSSVRHTLSGAERLEFRYPDGSRDAETLFLDPETLDLYIITKNPAHTRLYRYRYPQSVAGIDTVEFLTELTEGYILGGDMSSDGSFILAKSIKYMFIWKRNPDQPVGEVMRQVPGRLPYAIEPQGEAVAILPDMSGYFTLSETEREWFQQKAPVLYYYPRLKEPKKKS